MKFVGLVDNYVGLSLITINLRTYVLYNRHSDDVEIQTSYLIGLLRKGQKQASC